MDGSTVTAIFVTIIGVLVVAGLCWALFGMVSKREADPPPDLEYATFYIPPPTKPDVRIAMKIDDGNRWFHVRSEPHGYTRKVTIARKKG